MFGRSGEGASGKPSASAKGVGERARGFVDGKLEKAEPELSCIGDNEVELQEKRDNSRFEVGLESRVCRRWSS